MGKLWRLIGLVDITVFVVALAIVALPPRPVVGIAAAATTVSPLAAETNYQLARAEAALYAMPMDGAAVATATRLLTEIGYRDWNVELAKQASERLKGQPQRWHALLATAGAYVDRYDITHGVEFAGMALAACEQAGQADCPSHEQVRMDLYARTLKAGLASGIDARTDPIGFRKAADSALRMIYLPSAVGPTGQPAPASPKTTNPAAPTPVPSNTPNPTARTDGAPPRVPNLP